MKLLKLHRFRISDEGAFGALFTESGEQLAVTCEHAYEQPDGTLQPKIPPGRYRCVRGTHQLSTGAPFETYEVTGVPCHQGILIHRGNTEMDSHGCILVGVAFGSLGGQDAVLGSAVAFSKFLVWSETVDEFDLEVE